MKLVAFSGGKDSTALAYRLAELGESFSLLHTPTGNELPEVTEHVSETAERLGVDLLVPKGPKLLPLIDTFNALPNHRQRWCTRMIKIQPCIAFLKANPGSELLVGLRADEPTREGGIYGDLVVNRFPLREWGWGLAEVQGYLLQLGVKIPKRTDCAFCYGQRLTEWFALWRDHPELWAHGEALEAKTGKTFRSPSRDTWPVPMRGLREAFESGRVPRGQEVYDSENAPCRVCRILARTGRFRAFRVGGVQCSLKSTVFLKRWSNRGEARVARSIACIVVTIHRRTSAKPFGKLDTRPANPRGLQLGPTIAICGARATGSRGSSAIWSKRSKSMRLSATAKRGEIFLLATMIDQLGPLARFRAFGVGGVYMMKDECINFEGETLEDLEQFTCKDQRQEKIRKLTIAARKARLAGEIRNAQGLEDMIDRLYDRLPERLQW